MRVEDVAARDHLVIDYIPLVRRLCRKFSHAGQPMEDLVQVGSIGLIKAIDKYDPDRGSDFIAFAVPVIVGEIKNYFRDHGWSLKVPRKLQRQQRLVGKAIENLSQSLGHSPTIPEIAKATGLSEEEVSDTFELEMCGKPLSLEAEYYGHHGEEVSSLLTSLGNEDPKFEEVINKIDLTKALWYLNRREKAIICLKFYGGLTQTAIAQRLGISQMHVSRLQRKAINKLSLVNSGVYP